MRLERTQNHLKALNISFYYVERDGLGRITLKDTKIIEHYIRPNKINIYANTINLMDEIQLIGWINNNKDRLQQKYWY